ncbi:MAG: addiction module toxin RelE [Oscillospiraceae bacterium]|nr:addiction module toxin RelE [Oscillospiraceae bacterium]
MQVKLRKQPDKYLNKCPQNIHNKLINALLGLELWQGDIKRLEGSKNEYRLKIPPFRIIFTYIKGEHVITVTKISTRGDAYKKG